MGIILWISFAPSADVYRQQQRSCVLTGQRASKYPLYQIRRTYEFLSETRRQLKETDDGNVNYVLSNGGCVGEADSESTRGILTTKGSTAHGLENPKVTLMDDVIVTHRIIDVQAGVLALVGRSCRSIIIAEVGNNSEVTRFAHVPAFAPDSLEWFGTRLAATGHRKSHRKSRGLRMIAGLNGQADSVTRFSSQRLRRLSI